MKIIHVITDTNFGGAGRYLLYLIPRPAFHDHEVLVACPEGELQMRLDAANIKRLPIVSGKDISHSPRLTKELIDLFRAEKPDLVHTHGCLSGRIAGRLLKIPVVYTKHGQVRTGGESGVALGPTGFAKRTANRLAAGALSDGIIAVSKIVRDELIESGIKPSLIATIPNGIDLPPYLSVSKRESPRRAPLVGTVARLHESKALDVFLDAAKLVLASEPSARFIIGGTGPMEEVLKAKIRELRMEPYIKMPGFVADVPGFLSELDVYVLSSDHEGIGLAVLEAMAAGLPVVATAVGGVPEAVVDGQTGFLIPPRQPKALAQAIVRMLVDPDMATTMGNAGRQRACELFDAKVMAERTVSVYLRLVSRGGRDREKP